MDMGRRKRVLISICINILVVLVLYAILIGRGIQDTTTDDLKQHLEEMIAKDRPEIKKVSSELERLHMIREWVFSETMLAGTEDHYQPFFSEGKGKLGTKEFYDNLYEAWKNEGYYCSQITDILADIYMALGYRSLRMDLSCSDEEGNVVESHTVTLV